MKIVKNTKIVKFPREKGSVQSTFRRALDTAAKQKWTKVIIIGEGADMGSYKFSTMKDTTLLGLLEKAKINIYNDF